MPTSSSPKHIAVLYGGPSAEREVSLVSGKAVVDALHTLGHKTTLIDVDKDVARHLSECQPDIVFNALHGRYGEDGCIQGLLEILGIPYTHSGVLASALAMDKAKAREIFVAHDIPVAHGLVCNRTVFAEGDPMPRPYVIKPIGEGSSVGVKIVREGTNNIIEDWTFGDEVLVEQFIPGRELTVAVLRNTPLAVTEIRTSNAMFDYEAKYTSGHAEHLLPAPIDKHMYEKAMQLALKAHQVLGCTGLSRTDFRYDDTHGEPGRLYVLETNTQPGFTPLSLSPEQAAYKDISFEQLVEMLIEDATLGH